MLNPFLLEIHTAVTVFLTVPWWIKEPSPQASTGNPRTVELNIEVPEEQLWDLWRSGVQDWELFKLSPKPVIAGSEEIGFMVK